MTHIQYYALPNDSHDSIKGAMFVQISSIFKQSKFWYFSGLCWSPENGNPNPSFNVRVTLVDCATAAHFKRTDVKVIQHVSDFYTKSTFQAPQNVFHLYFYKHIVCVVYWWILAIILTLDPKFLLMLKRLKSLVPWQYIYAPHTFNLWNWEIGFSYILFQFSIIIPVVTCYWCININYKICLFFQSNGFCVHPRDTYALENRELVFWSGCGAASKLQYNFI